MMISSVGPSLFPQTSALVANLKANGLSVDKAALVATDAKAAVSQVGSVKRGPEGKAALRDALKERINADVTAGKLSADDANAIFQTFAQMDPANQNGGQTSGGQGGAPGGGAGQQAPQDDDATTTTTKGAGAKAAKGAGGPKGGGGGGGGGDSSSKTVLSETITVSGALETITTLYTDGTSETKTQAATSGTTSDTYSKNAIADQAKASTASTDSSAANSVVSKVQSYLSTIQPGSLFDILVQ